MQTSLNHIRPGNGAVIIRITAGAKQARHLEQLGLVPGQQVYCCYRSPSGQVTGLEVGEQNLVLRTRDLEKIRVRSLPDRTVRPSVI